MNEKTKREIGIVWGAFMSICVAVMIIVLLYIMATGQDIKNIHVAIVVIIAVQAMDRWPKKEGGEPMTKNPGNVLNAKAMKLNPDQKEMVLELANRTRAIGKEWMKGRYLDSQCAMSMLMLADWMRYAVGEKMHWEMSEEEQAALEEETQRQLYGTDEPRCLDCGWPLVIKKVPGPDSSGFGWWRARCFKCKVFAIGRSPTMAVDKLRAKMESDYQ